MPKNKPPRGSPCNGCGLCCLEEVCLIGEKMFDTNTPPCPGLVTENDRYLCGVVLEADKLPGGEIVRRALGIGAGCCSDNAEEKESYE